MKLAGLLAKEFKILVRSPGAKHLVLISPAILVLTEVFNRAGLTATLALVATFMGMLTASTLVVLSAKENARIREHASPTGAAALLAAKLLTSFIITMFALLVIAGGAITFYAAPPTIGTMCALALCALLASAVGCAVGAWARTIEAAATVDLLIGVITLVVAGVTQPWLAAPGFVAQFPFIATQVRDVIIIATLSAAAFIIAMILLRRQRMRDLGDGRRQGVVPLLLGERIVHDEIELADALDHMSGEEFAARISEGENPIAAWAQGELREERLAHKLRTKDKQEMLHALSEHLKKRGRHIKGGINHG